ncbi:hypothetical protein GBAR_LOCUS21801 [Geodia barretti]|uniref:Uncharacterized protein n=1 Tax=Geodia barretti TaxID=519541 RepID=A0AA35T154_GEOBA|nr:hypothetical protein GBAR_LOCUS21801 [Geodia barretti]
MLNLKHLRILSARYWKPSGLQQPAAR